MSRKFALLLLLALATLFLEPASRRSPAGLAAQDIFASPIQAGCYLARHDLCKIHVDPFTINLTSGRRLVRFQLVATRQGAGSMVIYDWRPDQSNPAPLTGSTYTPSPVAKDFAAACGQSYTLSLQGQDTGDASLYNLGVTNQFTCPFGTYYSFLPVGLK